MMFFNAMILSAQNISVMSYNIRYDNPNDQQNAWVQGDRRDKVIQIIQQENPDILGVQEALHHQVAYIHENLPQYQYVGVGRDDGEKAGEYVAIFFNSQRMEYIDSGYFWLSPTPEKPSKGWDATCCNRMATWIKLKIKNRILYVFNTHFDHEGKMAQQQSAILLKEKILPLVKANNQVILMGDLNVTPEDSCISTLKTFLKDTFQDKCQSPKATFNAFDLATTPSKRIDYIFTSKYLKIRDFKIIQKKIKGLYPSDHFPVKAVIKL